MQPTWISGKERESILKRVTAFSLQRARAKTSSVLACGRGENHVDSGNVAGSIGATANQQPY